MQGNSSFTFRLVYVFEREGFMQYYSYAYVCIASYIHTHIRIRINIANVSIHT